MAVFQVSVGILLLALLADAWLFAVLFVLVIVGVAVLAPLVASAVATGGWLPWRRFDGATAVLAVISGFLVAAAWVLSIGMVWQWNYNSESDGFGFVQPMGLAAGLVMMLGLFTVAGLLFVFVFAALQKLRSGNGSSPSL